MTLISYTYRLIPQWIKNFVRNRKLPWRISKLISPYLPTVICVDVGASYFPHGKWLMFLNSPNIQWLAVEPNEANIGYANKWNWPCQVSVCKTGLSREGGSQTLYVTNIDSGSSLLPPEILPSMKHRVLNLGYFFPLDKRTIDTLTLPQALEGMSTTASIVIKLDTQGTELSILQGAQPLFDAVRIVGVEMESTLLAQPVMKGSGKFWQACEYLERQGFELLHIDPIRAAGRSGRQNGGFLNECDAVFALRRDLAANLSVEYRASLLAFYLTNLFYEEALALLEGDKKLVNFLTAQRCDIRELTSTLQRSV